MRDTNTKCGVFFGLHLYRSPECPAFWTSMRQAVKLLKKHGYTCYYGLVFGDPYIQKSRNNLVKQFMDSNCDMLFFIADDLEYSPEAMLEVIETPGDLVVGSYRLKSDDVQFGTHPNTGVHNSPLVREDGCIDCKWAQTGFMRINRNVFEEIAKAHPELSFYGVKDDKKINVSYDYFPQGVKNHVWMGEDYAFCELWTDLGGKVWIVPDLYLTHHGGDKEYGGNYHEYLMSLPGGLKELNETKKQADNR